MYTFTNTNPIHYVQHHTNTKPNTDAVKPTLSSPPTHGFTITHTQRKSTNHHPRPKLQPNPWPSWLLLHKPKTYMVLISHKTHDLPHGFTQRITTLNSPFKAEWGKEREERSQEGERREKAERESQGSAAEPKSSTTGGGEEWRWLVSSGARAPAFGPIHVRENEVRERCERLRNQKKW